MLCEHLQAIDEAIGARAIRSTFRGQAWSNECREWVYYSCYLNREEIRKRFSVHPCVVDHEHFGTHDGQEEGLVCTEHRDGIMGIHSRSPSLPEVPVFP